MNITNELASPFCACADVSLGNGANGTVLDVTAGDVAFSIIRIWVVWTTGTFVLVLVLGTIVVGSATGADWISGIVGDGGGGGGAIDDDAWSGNGANGTVLGGIVSGTCWATVGCSVANGTETVDGADATAGCMAILFSKMTKKKTTIT